MTATKDAIAFSRIMRVVKIVLYVIYFIYIITSIYLSLNFNNLIAQFGIFTFFIFLKKWATGGIILLALAWVIENIHIYYLKKKIKELEKSATDVRERGNRSA